MLLVGAMDTGWRPGGGRMSENRRYCLTMLRPHHQRTCQRQLVIEMRCVHGGHTQTHSIGGARWLPVSISVGPFCRIVGEGFPRTNCVVSSAEKEVREGRSSSRVSRWNLTINLLSGTDI